jgi:hypothetical protein
LIEEHFKLFVLYLGDTHRIGYTTIKKVIEVNGKYWPMMCPKFFADGLSMISPQRSQDSQISCPLPSSGSYVSLFTSTPEAISIMWGD